MAFTKYNYKMLAAEAGVSMVTFRKHINIMLSDKAIRKSYGKKIPGRITTDQLSILIEHIPGLEHLKTNTIVAALKQLLRDRKEIDQVYANCTDEQIANLAAMFQRLKNHPPTSRK